jgi:hypothetical protein
LLISKLLLLLDHQFAQLFDIIREVRWLRRSAWSIVLGPSLTCHQDNEQEFR